MDEQALADLIEKARTTVIEAAKAWVDTDYGAVGELEAVAALCDAVHELDILENK